MQMNQPRLAAFDLGRTLAYTCGDGPSLGEQLTEASPLHPRRVAKIVRTYLHSVATITPQMCTKVSDLLQIDPGLLENYRSPGLKLLPATRPLLERMRALGIPVVIISNGCELDRDDAVVVRRELGDLLAGIYLSREQGIAKPDRRIFELAAREQGIPVSDMVHVGDKLLDDVQGALHAGARALWVNPHHATTYLPVGLDRYRSAEDLDTAADLLIDWFTGDASTNGLVVPRLPPTLPVRAEVLIENDQGQILCMRAPEDDLWTFSGGRLETYGGDSPAVAAAREVFEELGLSVVLGKDPDLTCWSRGEASDLSNKMILTFRWQWDPKQRVQRRDEVEVAEWGWFTRAEAARILHPRAWQRLAAIESGLGFLTQQ